jgi:hypothetical protein
VAKLPRRDAIKRLFETFGSPPACVAAVDIKADGSVRFEYRAELVASNPSANAVVQTGPKLVAGTPFPDDDSPINVADLTLNPIGLEDKN